MQSEIPVMYGNRWECRYAATMPLRLDDPIVSGVPYTSAARVWFVNRDFKTPDKI